jgi:hypothetical protein
MVRQNMKAGRIRIGEVNNSGDFAVIKKASNATPETVWPLSAGRLLRFTTGSRKEQAGPWNGGWE